VTNIQTDRQTDHATPECMRCGLKYDSVLKLHAYFMNNIERSSLTIKCRCK